MPAKKDKKLHGNNAKIDPHKKVESLYQSNAVTFFDRTVDETPYVDERNVHLAKDFVDENHK